MPVGTLPLPPLEVEDGPYVFAHFYQYRDLGELFRAKAGYVPLVANAIGWLSVRLPTTWIPYGMSWLPYLLCLGTLALPSSRWFRSVIPCDLSRTTLCVLLALAPIGRARLLAHTDYSIWTTLLLLLLLLIVPPPRGRAARLAYWTLSHLLVWSNPLSIVAAPLVLFSLATSREARIARVMLLGNLVVYQWLGISPSGSLWHRSSPDVLLGLAKDAVWSAIIVSEAWFRTSFGPGFFDTASKSVPAAIAAWAAIVVAVLWWVWRRQPTLRRPVSGLLYVSLALTFAEVISRGRFVVGALNAAPRYTYLQSMAFLALIVLIAGTVTAEGEQPAGRARATSGWRAAVRSRRVVLGGLVVYYLFMNLNLGYYVRLQHQRGVLPSLTHPLYCPMHPENGLRVREFFVRLSNLEDSATSDPRPTITVEKINDWSIAVVPRRAGGDRGRR